MLRESCPSTGAVKIAVVGSGYVGLVAAACFAEMGHLVACVDSDETRVAVLRRGIAPIHEPLLHQLLARRHGVGLSFTTDLHAAVQAAEAIFVVVGTPATENGGADLSHVETVVADIARAMQGYKVIVEKSTVPVYTSELIRRLLVRNGRSADAFDVASNPEFLREGTAVTDFLHPDRIVVGAGSEPAFALLARIYEPLTSGRYYLESTGVPGIRSHDNTPPLLRTSAKSAELIKHASNAFLALKISFINCIANVCEAVDADITEVAKGIGMDSRIGPKFLSPGLGYGGSCFPKDLRAFCSFGSHLGVNLALLHEVENINLQQQTRFLEKIRATLGTVRGRRIAVLGLAFKGGTDDLRGSPAVKVVECLLAEGADITAFDPAAMHNAERIFFGQVTMAENAYAAASAADALVILTDWQEFARLDLSRIRSVLRNPVILDSRNLYEPEEVAKQGLIYLSVGRPTALPVPETALLTSLT